MDLQGALTELVVMLAVWFRKYWPNESWAKIVAVLLDLAAKLIPVLFKGGTAKVRRLERAASQIASAIEEGLKEESV